MHRWTVRQYKCALRDRRFRRTRVRSTRCARCCCCAAGSKPVRCALARSRLTFCNENNHPRTHERTHRDRPGTHARIRAFRRKSHMPVSPVTHAGATGMRWHRVAGAASAQRPRPQTQTRAYVHTHTHTQQSTDVYVCWHVGTCTGRPLCGTHARTVEPECRRHHHHSWEYIIHYVPGAPRPATNGAIMCIIFAKHCGAHVGPEMSAEYSVDFTLWQWRNVCV